jgi:hypothetical protein
MKVFTAVLQFYRVHSGLCIKILELLVSLLKKKIACCNNFNASQKKKCQNEYYFIDMMIELLQEGLPVEGDPDADL